MSTQANIVESTKREGFYSVTAILPTGEKVGFNAKSQTEAVTYLKSISITRDQVAKDTDPVVVGVVELAPPAAVPPAQAELDRQAFTTLCDRYRTTEAEVLGAMGVSTQADLDKIHSDMKTAYKPEYAKLIVGLF